MEKKVKLFLVSILGAGVFLLIVALSAAVVKEKKENRELKQHYSSTLASETEEAKKEAKEISDKKEAFELVKEFIPAYFLMDEKNYDSSMEKISHMLSNELYNQIKDEEYGISDYDVELTASPIYEMADGVQTGRHSFTAIISLQYKSGNKDYGMHMQIWDFTCAYIDEKLQIIKMRQQQFVE